MNRAQRGFSFIEILVVMAIISVLATMVVVVIPRITETSKQTKSQDNVKNICTFLMLRAQKKGWKALPYNGKNFTLAVVAHGDIDLRQKANLETLFSPGDVEYGLEFAEFKRFEEITKEALKADTDFHELTSYAGRRNAEKDFRITPSQEQAGTMIICDDDDGPLHHKDGIIAGYSNAAARFIEWEDLGMSRPDNPDAPDEFLGDAATGDNELQKLYGR